MTLLQPTLRLTTYAAPRLSAGASMHTSSRAAPRVVKYGVGVSFLAGSAVSVRGYSSEATGSSTLVRQADPSAPRRQTITLVFLSSDARKPQGAVADLFRTGGAGPERNAWNSYIQYFRQAGYNCLDMNLVGDKLEDDLHSPIRLSSLQRQPVLFANAKADSAEALVRYIDPSNSAASSGFWGWIASLFGNGSGRPAISGLVVLGDEDAKERFGVNPKLNVLVVGARTDKSGKVQATDKDDVKEIERWLIRNGYEG